MLLKTHEKVVLGLSGFTALAIGVSIVAVPHAFYSSYGISLGNDASLLSELRAQAAGLAALGALMLAGVWRPILAPMSIAAALIVFIAFPAGRLVGLAVDGVPSDSVIWALAFELVVAAICVVVFGRRLGKQHPAL